MQAQNTKCHPHTNPHLPHLLHTLNAFLDMRTSSLSRTHTAVVSWHPPAAKVEEGQGMGDGLG